MTKSATLRENETKLKYRKEEWRRKYQNMVYGDAVQVIDVYGKSYKIIEYKRRDGWTTQCLN